MFFTAYTIITRFAQMTMDKIKQNWGHIQRNCRPGACAVLERNSVKERAIQRLNRSQALCAFLVSWARAMALHLIQRDLRRSGPEFGAQTKT